VDAPVVLTDANFDVVVSQSTVPVMVDFYADWCGPCKMMAPVFADFARRQRGRVLVAKVNTDENPGVSMRFGIRSSPTLTVMRGGQEVARQVGAVPMAALEQMVGGA
jgi:thioredoxin 2